MSASDDAPLPLEGSGQQPPQPPQPPQGEPQPIPQPAAPGPQPAPHPLESEPTPIPRPIQGEPQPISPAPQPILQPIRELEPIPQPIKPPDDEGSLSLVDDDAPLSIEDGPMASGKSSKIRAFGAAAAMAKKELTRPMNLSGTGATRCRLFHSKITIGAVDHMVSQINEWLDASDIEVKHVTDVVGTMEGKKAEPNLILTIWY